MKNKHIIGTLFFLIMSSCVFGQVHNNMITFELNAVNNPNGYANFPAAECYDVGNYNSNFRTHYGVRFWLYNLGGPQTPVLAQKGDVPPAACVNNCSSSSTAAAFASPPPPSGFGPDGYAPPAQQPNNADFENFFLTDDGCIDQIPSQTNVLYVEYDTIARKCGQASGYLLDIDGTGNIQEAWTINAVASSGNVYTLNICTQVFASASNNLGLNCNINPYSTASPVPGIGDALGAYWEFNLPAGENIHYLEFRYIGSSLRSTGLAFDNFSFCSAETTPSCCNLDMGLALTNTGLGVGPYSTIYSSQYDLTVTGAPVQEIRASIIDMEFENDPTTCEDCKNEPRHWGKLFPTTSIGGLDLEQQPYWQGNNSLSAYIQSPDALWEAIWSGRPTDFSNGRPFPIAMFLPQPKDLGCCVSKAKFCLKVSVMDVDCNYCDTIVCCEVTYDKDGLINDCFACNEPIQLNIQKEWIDCCTAKLTAVGADGLDLQWSNGSTSKEITVNSSGNYTATASKECKGQTITASSSETVDIMDGGFPQLAVPNALRPNSPIPENRIARITHIGPALGASPAYNATEYKLYIFNRWDTGAHTGAFRLINGKIDDDCKGFENGEIFWDGKDASGQLVQQGVYPYILELTNCDGTDDTHEFQEWVCTKWGYLIFPPWKKVCKEWQLVFNNRRIGTFTVVY